MARSSLNNSTAPHRIALVIYPGVQALDAVGPLEVFSTANHLARAAGLCQEDRYQLTLISTEPGPVTSSSGYQLVAQCSWQGLRPLPDTLLLAGGSEEGLRGIGLNLEFQAWLRETSTQVSRLGSVCTGAFLLGEAGLLNGRQATTHWGTCAMLAERYSDINVIPDRLFVQDGHIYTSAGVTAGMDLALAFVEEDLGHRIALDVAKHLVLFLKRPGGQSQFSTFLERPTTTLDRMSDVVEWIQQNLQEPLEIEQLAARAAMSPRHFSRLFKKETELTPGDFIERARVEQARILIEESELLLESIAIRCGFGSEQRMRRAFKRLMGITPLEHCLRVR